MSLLNQTKSASAVAAETVRSQAVLGFKSIVSLQRAGIEAFWNAGVPPQDVADALGTDAGRAFQYYQQLTGFIQTVAAAEGVNPKLSKPTNAFTINPDGTVTILPGPYAP